MTTLFFTRCFFHLHFPKDPAHSTTSSQTWWMIQKLKILKWSGTYGWFSPMITRLLFFLLFFSLPFHSLLPKVCHIWQGQKKLTQNLNKNWATWNLCFLNLHLVSPSPFCVLLMIRNKEHEEFLHGIKYFEHSLFITYIDLFPWNLKATLNKTTTCYFLWTFF